MARRVVLLVESEQGYRYQRFVQEAGQRNLAVLGITLSEVSILDQAVCWKGKAITFKSGDILWADSYSAATRYVIQHLSFQSPKIFIWPGFKSLQLADKFTTAQFFLQHKIPTPKTLYVHQFACSDQAVQYVGGFPCILKKTYGSQGKYVELVHTMDEIRSSILTHLTDAKHRPCPSQQYGYLLQEYIKREQASDIRVLCVGDKVIGAIQRTAQQGFKANISLGGSASPIPIDEELQRLSLHIMKQANLFHAGIDFIQSDRGYLALEINICPQFIGFEKATGLNVAGAIIDALLLKVQATA